MKRRTMFGLFAAPFLKSFIPKGKSPVTRSKEVALRLNELDRYVALAGRAHACFINQLIYDQIVNGGTSEVS
jgi:hypothetical protein